MEDIGLNFKIHDCLKSLGISSPGDWDVLVFVYRHQASLASAEQIARLLGYPGIVVADALDHLESLKLVRRSRASQGVRFYQFKSPDADHPSYDCFRQLIRLTENRAGRLLVIKELRQPPVGLMVAGKKDRNG